MAFWYNVGRKVEMIIVCSTYLLNRFHNGRFNILSFLLRDSWVGGRGAIGQKYPGKKPQDAHCPCKEMVAGNLVSISNICSIGY